MKICQRAVLNFKSARRQKETGTKQTEHLQVSMLVVVALEFVRKLVIGLNWRIGKAIKASNS